MPLDPETLAAAQRAQAALDNPQAPGPQTGIISGAGPYIHPADYAALTDFQKAAAFNAAANMDKMSLTNTIQNPGPVANAMPYRQAFMGAENAQYGTPWIGAYPALDVIQRAADIGHALGRPGSDPATIKNPRSSPRCRRIASCSTTARSAFRATRTGTRRFSETGRRRDATVTARC